MSYRTKGYVLASKHVHRISPHDSIELPEGSFILPMNERWVPKEIKEKLPRLAKGEIYAYTKYGVIVIPETLVRLGT